MSKKNRVRHGQFSTDIGTAAGTADVSGDENRSTGSVALAPAQPSTDAGDGAADAGLLGANGIDGGDQAAAPDPVSAVGQAGQSAEEQAEEVNDGQAQEAPGDGGEDPAASGNGGIGLERPIDAGDSDLSISGNQSDAGLAERLAEQEPDVVSVEVDIPTAGDAMAYAFSAIVVPSTNVGIDLAELVPSAQAWRPHTAVEKAGMTAAASMNEAFWVLVGPGATFDPQFDRLHSNYSLWHPAADFITANRDAPAEAIPIHLALKRIGGSTKPEPLEKTLWTVFKTVFLLVHDAIVEAEAKQAEAPAEPAAGWPGDLAMQPQPSAFDAAGFSPRR